MKKTQKRFNYYRLLVSSALITGGLFQLALPVFAAGTVAGASIKNTATATYEDPNSPGTEINATSNVVTATVAEVAGITNVPAGIQDNTPASPVLPGDVIVFDFKITNVGNDPTKFKLDGNDPVITGPGTPVIATTGSTLYDHVSYDVDYNGDGTINVAGGDLTDQTKATVQGLLLPPGAIVTAHFPVTVDATATSGAPISAKFGDVPPNDNSADTQNQEWDGTDANDDVRTLDGNDGESVTVTGYGTITETSGQPAVIITRREREAGAFQTQLVGANPQAFAAVLKTNSYSPGASATTPFSDDEITYSLSLRVDSAAPAGASTALTPSDLVGTVINIGGTLTDAVLVSDAIPANTFLSAAPTAPLGWTVVYSTDDPTAAPNKRANDATLAWTETAPTFPDTGRTIKRVGFAKKGTATGTSANGSTVTIAKGTTVSPFSFKVKFVTGSTLETAGGSVYNVAQLLGSTPGVDPDGAGGPAPTGAPKLIYDESGDQAPSNFNDNGTPGSTDPTTGLPVISNGVADPNNDGVDNGNNNTGTGAGGEDNVVSIAAPNSIFNGPENSPFAVGPTDNNNDFTNKSTPIAANVPPGTAIDPEEITFTNTLQAPNTLTNVLLRPVGGGDTGGPTGVTTGTGVQSLPNDTTVTLTYGANTAVYTYKAATDTFVYSAGQAIQIPTLIGATPTNYTVKINLPAGTVLSTDSTAAEKGYSVPILAFSDNGGNTGTAGDGVLNGDEAFNRTIDRLYTGFLKITKKSAVLQGTALNVPSATDAALNTAGDGVIAAKNVVPGNILQYAIEYQNISSVSSGTGNVILNASNVKITDSGVPYSITYTVNGVPTTTAVPNANGWGLLNSNNIIVTSHVTGSVINKLGSGGSSVTNLTALPNITATINYFAGSGAGANVLEQTGTTQDADVTKYQITLPVPVAPGEGPRTFGFQRTVN